MGAIVCLLGKSGTGKDTLLHLALRDLPLRPLVPYTTRPRRAGEREGDQYHFVTPEEMEQMAAAGQMIERRSYQTVTASGITSPPAPAWTPPLSTF